MARDPSFASRVSQKKHHPKPLNPKTSNKQKLQARQPKLRACSAVMYLLVNAGVWVNVTDLLCWKWEWHFVAVRAGRPSQTRNQFRNRVIAGSRDVLWPARIDVAILLDFCHVSIVSNLGRKSHFSGR